MARFWVLLCLFRSAASPFTAFTTGISSFLVAGLVSALVVLVITPFADAHRPQTIPSHVTNVSRDESALALIQQSLSVMGVPVSQDFGTIAKGTVTDQDGNVSSLTIETLGTGKARHDLGSDLTSVVNGGNGFLVMNGKRSKLPVWMTRFSRPEHLPSLSLMADYSDPNLQVQYIGLENVNGKPAHHLRLSMLPTDGLPVQLADLISEFHVFIDSASMLVVKTRTFDFSPYSPQNRTPVETFFSDYRQQDGALVPFHLVRYLVNQKDSETTFTSISLNASVPDSDFQ